MTQDEYRLIVDEFDKVIVDTRELMERFEASGMDELIPDEYQRLHDIYRKAVQDQRAYALSMLEDDSSEGGDMNLEA